MIVKAHFFKISVIFIFVFIGCATEPMSYEQSTTADYAGNNQYEINSIGNSTTQREMVRQNFYRKAYEVCASKNLGFKIISKNSGGEGPVSYTTGYCSFRQCYPSYYYRDLPFDTGVIECTGQVDPELKNKLSTDPTEMRTQTATFKNENETVRTNSVSVELWGRAWLYSLDYDHLFSNRFALGAGISYWNTNYWRTNVYSSTTVIPIYGNYYFPSRSTRFFVTAGADMILASGTTNSNIVFQSSGGAAVLGGGFEYRGNQGFLFRLSPYIILGSSTVITIGASLGGVF